MEEKMLGGVPPEAECAIVLGGDGTLIRVANVLKERNIVLLIQPAAPIQAPLQAAAPAALLKGCLALFLLFCRFCFSRCGFYFAVQSTFAGL